MRSLMRPSWPAPQARLLPVPGRRQAARRCGAGTAPAPLPPGNIGGGLGCAHPEHDEKSLLPIGTAGAAMSQEHVRGSGYIAGTWDIDPVHSHVGFSARHLMVSKVRGNFTRLGGQIVTADRKSTRLNSSHLG